MEITFDNNEASKRLNHAFVFNNILIRDNNYNVLM